MLDELSKRIKKCKDFDKLCRILEDMLNDSLESEFDTYNGCCFGMFLAYDDHIYNYIRMKQIPSMADRHVHRIDKCIEWLNRNENQICEYFDKTLLTTEDIRNRKQYSLEFSEN